MCPDKGLACSSLDVERGRALRIWMTQMALSETIKGDYHARVLKPTHKSMMKTNVVIDTGCRSCFAYPTLYAPSLAKRASSPHKLTPHFHHTATVVDL